MEAILTALGLTKGATIGGFLGALVSLKFIQNLSWWQGVTSLLTGWICATRLAPLVLVGANLSESTEGGIAFLIGVFGLSLVAAVMKAIPEIITALKDKWTK